MSKPVQLPTVAIDTRYTQDVIPILDTSKFEHMQRIAIAMAECSTIPDSFRYVDGKPDKGELPRSTVVANCFRVVNQAVRWGFDPFAVMDCASIVHGKLCWEGKLVAAVVDAKLGVKLDYSFDDKPGQKLGVVVSGTLPSESKPRTIEGRVEHWHRGPKSPWANEGDWKRQLRYRGAREWSRAHAPAVMLGIYTDDELQDIAALDVPTGQRAVRMKDITPATAVIEPPDPDAVVTPATIPAATTPPDIAAGDELTDADGFLTMLREHVLACDGDKALIAEVFDHNEETIARLPRTKRSEAEALFGRS